MYQVQNHESVDPLTNAKVNYYIGKVSSLDSMRERNNDTIFENKIDVLNKKMRKKIAK